MRNVRIGLASMLAPLCLSLAVAQGFDETTKLRMATLMAHIKQTADAAGATVVRGSMHSHVFGPDAQIAFYTLEGRDGSQQQRLAVMERRPDTAKGEVAPAIEGPHITMKRYAPRFVVFGDVRVGDKGRVLDVAKAQVSDATSFGYELLATVTVPIVGGGTTTFKITHRVREPQATITEGR